MSKQENSLITNEQYLELIFRQIEMIQDREALEAIAERVQHQLHIVGDYFSTASSRRIGSTSKVLLKEEMKKQEHFKIADRRNDLILGEQPSCSVELSQMRSISKDERESRTTTQIPAPPAPNHAIKNFDWIYNEKFSRYGLTLKDLPEDVTADTFEDTQHNNKNLQGQHVPQLIDRILQDKQSIEGDWFSPNQVKWIRFIVKAVKDYCKEVMGLTELKTERQLLEQLPKHARKIDAIFFNQTKAIVIDWKFSPYSTMEQIYMQEGSGYSEQIQEARKLFNFQKEVFLLIVPLKRLKDLELIELSNDDVEKLQKESINQDIFYQAKYKKMRNNILSKHFSLNQKCCLGEGKKQGLTLREYFLDIVSRQRKNQLEYYGDFKNCFGKHPPQNKEQFWAFHVLLKEIQRKNERIIALVEQSSQPSRSRQKQDDDEVDLIAMAAEHSVPVLKKQNSSYRYKFRQNKSVLQFICDKINQDMWSDGQADLIIDDTEGDFDDGEFEALDSQDSGEVIEVFQIEADNEKDLKQQIEFIVEEEGDDNENILSQQASQQLPQESKESEQEFE